MNREIKFRGKRVDNGEFVYGFLTHNKESGKSWIGNFAFNNYYFVEVDTKTVGQYTGLKDKNGKEIYEGDILKLEWSTANMGKYFQSDDMWNNHELVVKVEWKNLGFVFIENNGKQHSKRSSATIEVIGNIYETK